MKKIFAFLLMLVLIFSLSVTSFASSHSSELDALNSIDSWSESIWQVLVQVGSSAYNIESDVDSIRSNSSTLVNHAYNILNNILDINEYSRLNNDELIKINTAFERLNLNLFGSTVWLQPFATAVKENLDYQKTAIDVVFGLSSNSWHNYDDSFFYHVDENLLDIGRSIELFSDRFNSFNSFFRQEFDENTGEGSAGYALYMLQQVLADEEDLAMKESQKANQESAFDSFFNGGSDTGFSTSLGSFDFSGLSSGLSFFDSFFFAPEGYSLPTYVKLNESFDIFGSVFSNQDFGDGLFPLGWFSDATANDISRVQSTFSRDSSTRIVTHYYSDQMETIENVFGGIFE